MIHINNLRLGNVYHGKQAREVEVRHAFGLPPSAGHPQPPEPWATTGHKLPLGCAAKMPCLYLNPSSVLGSQSSPSSSDHAQKRSETQGQRKASPAGGSRGSSELGGTTQLLTGGMLLEQPSAGPECTSAQPTTVQRQRGKCKSPFSFGGSAPTQLRQ